MFNKAINQNSVKVPKVIGPTKTSGTSVFTSRFILYYLALLLVNSIFLNRYTFLIVAGFLRSHIFENFFLLVEKLFQSIYLSGYFTDIFNILQTVFKFIHICLLVRVLVQFLDFKVFVIFCTHIRDEGLISSGIK